MMADAVLVESRLRLLFKTGEDEEGNAIVKTKTFNKVRKSATADQLHAIALALASLSNYSLESVERNDSLDILG